MKILRIYPAGETLNTYTILCTCGRHFEELSSERYATCTLCNKKELFNDLRDRWVEWLDKTYIDVLPVMECNEECLDIGCDDCECDESCEYRNLEVAYDCGMENL